jgi:phosphopantetheinyl transferase
MPLYLVQPKPLLGVWKIDESADDLLSRLRLTANCRLPEGLRSRSRIQEWLAVRVLLKELLGEETRISYRPDGSPYLPDRTLHIGISHTKGYAAIVLSKLHPVSVDIEYPSDRASRVCCRFMSCEEMTMIDPLHEAEHLLLCWCAKETLYKLVGEKEVDMRHHLRLDPFAFGASGVLTASETRTPGKRSYKLGYMFNKYFAMTWSREMTVDSLPSLVN